MTLVLDETITTGLAVLGLPEQVQAQLTMEWERVKE